MEQSTGQFKEMLIDVKSKIGQITQHRITTEMWAEGVSEPKDRGATSLLRELEDLQHKLEWLLSERQTLACPTLHLRLDKGTLNKLGKEKERLFALANRLLSGQGE